MPLELKPFRLPSKWSSQSGRDENSPRLYLNNSLGLDLPIGGGWGYSKDDCVVIDKNDPTVNAKLPFEGTQVEYTFVEKRIYAELIVFRQRGDQFSGIEWNMSLQKLQDIDNRKFDVLDFRVSALTDRDWEFLKRDWEKNDGYKDDEDGAKRHLDDRDLRTCFYDTQFWFDITSFYGR